MTSTLKDLEMYSGQQYEVIITTWNPDMSRNAAPFGTIVKNEMEIVNRIFKGSTTLENILRNKKFVVNITNNPIYFSYALVENIPEEFYINDETLVLKDIDAHFDAEVKKTEYMVKKDDPIDKSETCYINSKVKNININNTKVPVINRGIHCIIESLVNYSRIDKVNNDIRYYYIGRFKENNRVINKVGSNDDKKAMKYIIKNLEKKGYKI